MSCEYCGAETDKRFCSRECRDAVEGFDYQLRSERKVEFTDKHEPALAERLANRVNDSPDGRER